MRSYCHQKTGRSLFTNGACIRALLLPYGGAQRLVFMVDYVRIIRCVCAWIRADDPTTVSVFSTVHKVAYGDCKISSVSLCLCDVRFLNYKLKSVAHLPWRVLVYKSLNTFIDDLFSFIIRMPTMARVSCFRDDVVFFIYLYQRWLYPVDTSRPIEGGGEGSDKVDTSNDVSESKKTR